MTRRFYVEPPAIDSDDVEMPEHLAERLAKVLRLRAGDTVTLFDGLGTEARVQLDAVSARRATGRVVERIEGAPEPAVRLTLFQSITTSATPSARAMASMRPASAQGFGGPSSNA